MEDYNAKKIIKEFQEMKPSLAIKKMDFSKFPREVSEKIQSDLSEISDEVLDLQEGKPNYKKWIERMAEIYPEVFGIKFKSKEDEKNIKNLENNESENVSFENKIKELEIRINVIKKMIKKQPNKKEELNLRIKVISKMIKKFKSELK
jgi:uncharacterized protein Veg